MTRAELFNLIAPLPADAEVVIEVPADHRTGSGWTQVEWRAVDAVVLYETPLMQRVVIRAGEES